MILTVEDIREIAEQLTWYDGDTERLDPVQFARSIEAKIEAKMRDQKPFAWYQPVESDKDGWMYIGKDKNWMGYLGTWRENQPLYKHPAPIPEGYALVPVEPTEAMLIQITPVSAELSEWKANYKEMLAARSGE